MTKHLVVARYLENCDWITNVNADKIFLYEKSDPSINTMEGISITPLENFGRESHTYIHHIVEHYNHLPDWLIFCQGNPFDHCPNFIEIASERDSQKMWQENCRIPHDVKPQRSNHHMPLGHFYIGDIKNIDWGPQIDAVHAIWQTFNINIEVPEFHPAAWGANFAVAREGLKLRSHRFWKELLDLHRIYYGLPWALESLWSVVFDPKVIMGRKPRLLL